MLIVVISVTGLVYSYASNIFTSRTSSVLTIFNTFNNTVFVKNEGTAPITSFLSITVDNKPVSSYIVYPLEPSGLVGYWTFDEGTGTTALDISGNKNTGILVASPNWVNGRFGSAINFPSTSTYVNLGTNNLPNGTGLSLTVLAWVNIAQLTNWHDIVTHNWSPTPGVWDLYINLDGRAIFSMNSSQVQKTAITAANELSTNKWYQIVGTYDGTNIKIYVNGSLRSTFSAPNLFLNSSGPLRICNTCDDGGIGTVTVDEVKIYNRALSADEIKASFNLGAPINAGASVQLKVFDSLSPGVHKLKICTVSYCTSGFLAIQS